MNKTIWGNGFHLTPEAMNFLQNEFTEGLSGLSGEDAAASYVVSGCNVVGGVRTDGFVVLAGELMPFKGNNTNTDYIGIVQTVGSNTYKSGSPEPAYITRYAECVASADSALAQFSQLPRRRVGLAPAPTQWITLEGVANVSTAEAYTDITWDNSCRCQPVETASKRWRVDEQGNLLVNGVLSLTETDASALAYFCPIPRRVKFRCDAFMNDYYGKVIYSVFATIGTDGALYLDADDFVYPTSRHGVTKLLFPMTVIPLY